MKFVDIAHIGWNPRIATSTTRPCSSNTLRSAASFMVRICSQEETGVSNAMVIMPSMNCPFSRERPA